ncbi:MAG: Gfo/Idh/MocA family oxidoreductase [bacterium]|nr:Gfo/Idh/MocA family oxidoreductase [bacterium]
MQNNKIPLAVIGGGGWGKNLIRTFASLPGADLKFICDVDEQKLENYRAQYPSVSTTTDFSDVLNSGEISAIVLVTPAETHYELIKQALEKGSKHVFTEKPLSLSPDEAEELVQISDETGLTLMVGHLLLYHPAVVKLKELIDSGELGDIYCLYSSRLNLGKVRKTENSWWSLAPHDISIINYLLGSHPLSVSAQGQCFVQDGVQDLVFATMNYPDKVIAQVHVSWLDPHKERKLTIVGSKKMVVFDDMESAEKIKIYDKGVMIDDPVVSYNDFFSVRSGDINIPHIGMQEPLKVECNHFLESVRNGTKPLSDAVNGLDVVKVLSAGQQSMDNRGELVILK